MIYLLVIFTFFAGAHEELGSLSCQDKKGAKLSIVREARGYRATTNKPMQEFKFTKFKMKDEIQNNQIFDVYSVEEQGLKLVVRRPETKGKVKSTIAQLNNQTFGHCVKIK